MGRDHLRTGTNRTTFKGFTKVTADSVGLRAGKCLFFSVVFLKANAVACSSGQPASKLTSVVWPTPPLPPSLESSPPFVPLPVLVRSAAPLD